MTLSIVIPVYNVEQYLGECLNSILPYLTQQTEIILVDDGSTDNSKDICDNYKDNLNVTVIHKQNGGLSSARNCGIENAKGDYLFFVDSDDTIPPDAIENILQALKQNPDVLYVGVEERDEKLQNIVKTSCNYGFDTSKKISANEILNKFFDLGGMYLTLAQGKIIKREYALKHDLFFKKGIFHEDDEWIGRLLATNPEISFLNNPCYIYRHRENSIITSNSAEKIFKKNSDRLGYLEDVLKIYTENPHYSKAVRYYSSMYMSALSACNKIDADKTKEIYNSTYTVLKHLKYSENSKQKILYWIFKIFGKSVAYKFIVSRY